MLCHVSSCGMLNATWQRMSGHAGCSTQDMSISSRCLTMQMEPATASRMPANFCSEPASRPSMTPSIAVITGMDGCMHVAIMTPLMSIPTG